MHFNQLFIFLATLGKSLFDRIQSLYILLIYLSLFLLQTYSILGIDLCDKRCRSKARVDARTPQIKGFRLSVHPQKFEAKRVTNGLQKCKTTAPACYPGPSQSSRSVPGAGQIDQGSWDENGWEGFENEHPAIMKHKCRDFLSQKFGLF